MIKDIFNGSVVYAIFMYTLNQVKVRLKYVGSINAQVLF